MVVCLTGVPMAQATAFWQTPYPAKRTEFSAMLAAKAGTVPAYSPLIPSLAKVVLKQVNILVYKPENKTSSS